MKLAFEYLQKVYDYKTDKEAQKHSIKMTSKGYTIEEHYRNNLPDGNTYTIKYIKQVFKQ